MGTLDDWSVKYSSGFGGSFIVAASGAKYELKNARTKKDLYWAGAGLGLSLPGLPASFGVSTPAHWSKPGSVIFSTTAPHRFNKYVSADGVFSGSGVIIEFGLNNAVLAMFGVQNYVQDYARKNGINDYENHMAVQLLLFNTNITIANPPALLAEVMTIATELAVQGQFSSIYTKAVALIASTSTAVDSAGITGFQGLWYRA